MYEQTLSPEIEKALADLRQAIINQLNQTAPAPAASIPVAPPEAISSPISPVTQANELPTATAAPVPADVQAISNGIDLPSAPAAPAAPAFEPVVAAPQPVAETPSINLPDMNASPSNVTDLSGLTPQSEPDLTANNGLDDSAPILPPVGGPDLSAPVDLTAATPAPVSAPLPPVVPVDVSPAPAPIEAVPSSEPTAVEPVAAPIPTPEPVTAPAESSVPTGLPKANSLLSNVLKKGWNSNQ